MGQYSRLDELPVSAGLRKYLTELANLGGFPYCALIEFGQVWRPKALPNFVPKGTKKECFKNALRLAHRYPEFRYVEGYGYEEGLVPVYHAWCVNDHGDVIDPTWPFPEKTQYFGFAVSVSLVHAIIDEIQSYGVLFGLRNEILFNRFIQEFEGCSSVSDSSGIERVRAQWFKHYGRKSA